MKNDRQLKFFLFIGVFSIGIYSLSQSYGIGFSSTPSLPFNIFIMDKNNFYFTKNDLIVFKYPGEDIYNYKKDEKFVKKVSCFSGDRLEVDISYNYFCNGVKIGQALLQDGDGRKLEPFIFNGIIPDNQYFVSGTHIKSWDSRYWGFVSKDRIIGKAKGII